MGIVFAEITLKNAGDVVNVGRGIISEQDIRQTNVQAIVDTGSMTLVINESIRDRLGLTVRGTRQVTMANNSKETAKIAETVEIHWKNRSMTCQPVVVENCTEVLLGALPLEDMDLIVDPVRQELVGAHGDEIVTLVL